MKFLKNTLAHITLLALIVPVTALSQGEVKEEKKQEAEIIVIEETIDRDGNKTINKTIRKGNFTDEEIDEIVRLETGEEDDRAEQGIAGERGYLGVMIENAPTGNGVRVTGVVEKSPAEMAGLQEGDVIVEVGGKAVTTTAELVAEVGGYAPGEKVSLAYMRNDETLEVTATLSKRSDYEKTFEIINEDEIFGEKEPKEEQPPKRQLGVYLKNADNGVRVNEVVDGSIASQIGLKPDDIVTVFGGKQVRTSGEMIDAIQSAEANKSITIEFLRNGEKQTTEVEFDF